MSSFNPNNVGLTNGNIFGFPYTYDEAQTVIIPVPWDVTTSYHKGTANGPEAILKASPQIDFYDAFTPKAWEHKVYFEPVDSYWKNQNTELNKLSSELIRKMENGIELSEKDLDNIQHINTVCAELHQFIYQKAKSILNDGKTPVLVGGEHSTPLGLIRAYSEKYDDLSILQIDAHADLRIAYEKFDYSHASIMHNVLQETDIQMLVQVGIRDICQDEVDYIEHEPRINTFFDYELKHRLYEGETWEKLCNEIVTRLTDTVYVSFDIDGLNPKLCPHTGTPVPGGFEIEQINYLLLKLLDSGKKIVGFDLNEVAPNPNHPRDDWDANVGARVLWMLLCRLYNSFIQS